jgi:hypothetical protein
MTDCPVVHHDVDASDPESMKYLTFVAGGKDPHTLPEIPAPADAGR